uniref:Neprosin PEP catalytic domain-containing protein n=1 Tax=Leersia perrieri TaxID=77586 RepID=A0A0D9XEQ9_9ORYZ
MSGVCIAAFGKQAEGVNTFEVGFHVFPELYNNSDVHFYTFWTRDAYSKTGCYNLRCPGFVPASGAALLPGQAVAPPSTYDGDDGYIKLSLHTDPNTGDWVVYRDDLGSPSFLGYFLKDLCPDLIGSAPRLAWSGYVSYPKNEKGPPMGSGHFANEGEGRAAYFKNMKIFNSKEPDGYLFYYGGPAGCSG